MTFYLVGTSAYQVIITDIQRVTESYSSRVKVEHRK